MAGRLRDAWTLFVIGFAGFLVLLTCFVAGVVVR